MAVGENREPANAHVLWTFMTALSGASDELERARLMASGLPSLLSCGLSGVALLDETNDTWSLIAENERQDIGSPRAERLLTELEPVLQEALRGPSVLFTTLGAGTEDARVVPSLDQLGIRSLAVATLRTLRRHVGMMLVGRKDRDGFSREEELILSTLGEHFAIGLENLRLVNDLKHYSENLQGLVEERTEEHRLAKERHQVLLEVNNAIITNLDKTSLLQAIAEALRNVLPFDRAALTLLDAERDVFKVHALASTSSAKRFLTVGTEFPRKGSAVETTLKENRPRIRHHLDQARLIGVESRLVKEGIRSYVSVPLMAKGEPFGILNLGSRESEEYSQADAELFMAVGRQVALAVENMLAYEEIAELKARLEQENLYLLEEIKTHHKFEEIIGGSSAMKKVLQGVEQVAPTDATVLILGETGTGKELVARAIHSLSPLKSRTLVKVNCAALPAGLIESELFGHEKGAFTGAIARKTGRFELADGGSIFLDEIGDLPLELQAKLLRVLQEGAFERVGSSQTIEVRVRVIAATNRDLIKGMKERTFREDLYYRLNVFPLSIPPLRERRDDIPLLVRHFVLKHGTNLGKQIESVPQRRMDDLQAYSWPGNVRELENVIERAMILSQGPELNLGDWAPGPSTKPQTEGSTLSDVERDHILKTLELTNWRLSGEKGAAKILGLKRTTLQGRMRKLGIRREP